MRGLLTRALLALCLLAVGVSPVAAQLDPAARGLALRAQTNNQRLALLDRVQRQAARAALSNPRNVGLYAGSLTITDRGSTLPTETNQSAAFTSAAPGAWAIHGGSPTLINGAWRFVSSVIAATGGNLGTSNGATANFWRARIVHTGRYLAVRLLPSTLPYRLLIDGKPVSLVGTTLTTTTGTTLQYLLLDFASRGTREVTVEGQAAQGFGGGFFEATGRVSAPNDSASPRFVWLGDSYAYGAGPVALGDGIAPVAADWLGARVLASGSSGTGWATTVNYRFDERIANGDLGLSGTPEFIVLQGSYNDRAQPLANIQANALAGLRAARARYPGVPIVVLGAFAGATGPSGSAGSSDIVGAENSVAAAVAAFGDPLCRFVSVSTDGNGAWVNGTGKVGTTTGTGSSDWATQADGVHPSDEGAGYIGQRAAQRILSALTSMLGSISFGVDLPRMPANDDAAERLAA